MKTIGIIGGLGPDTTAEFYLALTTQCQKRGGESRPHILIASVPLPYQIEADAIERNEGVERYAKYLIAEAGRLESAGADFLVIPCNSVHIFIEEVRASIKIPVISILETTVDFLRKNAYQNVGIVATSMTIKNRLYEDILAKNSIDFCSPNELQQAKLNKIIHNLVMGLQKNDDRKYLIDIVYEYENAGVDCVIMACTDLQLLIPEHPRLKIFDTMQILANACIEKIYS